MNAGLVRLRATISGSVQGVGYRQFVLHHAQRLSLHGWVRNRWDRKVELIAEGQRHDLQLLLDHLAEGPPASSVRAIDVEWAEPTNEFRAFEIRG